MKPAIFRSVLFSAAVAAWAAPPSLAQAPPPGQAYTGQKRSVVVPESLGQEKSKPYPEQLRTGPEALRQGLETTQSDLKKVDPRSDFWEQMRAAKAIRGDGFLELLENPPEIRAVNGVLTHTLKVEYGDNFLFNIKQNKPVRVHLRSYNGKLFGSTLRVKPGEKLELLVDNQLPPNPPPANPANINVPHDFNTTNLHTHGLHVSPSGNSDNVLIAVPPGSKFQNEIAINRRHDPGTFWYHSHVHGSTAIQVTSGVAGALIVEGGLDEVAPIAEAQERIMLFQQVPYLESAQTPGVYEVEDFATQLSGPLWDNGVRDFGWRTTINGQTHPIILMQPQEVQRWRMIHAGLREEIEVSIVPYEKALATVGSQLQLPGAPPAPAAAPAQDIGREAVRARKQALVAETPQFHEVAADGLAYGFAWARDSVELFPGYRSDVLVKIDQPGLYVLMDLEASDLEGLQRSHESPKVLGYVFVGGPPKPMRLPSNAELAHLRPHADIVDAEVDEPASGGAPSRRRTQKVELNFTTNPPGFFVDGVPYNPANPARVLELDKAYEWNLASLRANHPYHIHVNPFQIVEWRDAEGKSRLPIIDGVERTVWKDTVLIRAKPAGAPAEAETLRLRARNEVYIGRFVLHCHILDHEDQGMMQEVEVVGPGTAHHAAAPVPHPPGAPAHGAPASPQGGGHR